MDALNAKAQAEVAYDTAVVTQHIDKPDSVLAMTCFNQAAGVSAELGGTIFSGDFTTELTPIVSEALEDFYDDFEDAQGYDSASTPVDYTATALTSTFDCTALEDLWTDSEDEGVNGEVPYASMDDMISGVVPAGAGDDMTDTWDASETNNTAFSDLSAAVGALPPPPPVPDFSTANGSCDVLLMAGIVGSCP